MTCGKRKREHWFNYGGAAAIAARSSSEGEYVWPGGAKVSHRKAPCASCERLATNSTQNLDAYGWRCCWHFERMYVALFLALRLYLLHPSSMFGIE